MNRAKRFALLEGVLNILIASLTPIGTHLMSPQDMSFRAAVFGGTIAGMVAARQWLLSSPFAPRQVETPRAGT